ncbi:hypothetical protein VDGE_08385 [Verticillium dahliae]|uniref:Uncharacterized protein n=1 Tax=Verticillium dahliae TaxID=27337 RepID=A0A444RNV3_VERDA|nr:hypothetical protein VDGE_08385 [Verticillium dahliae]
MSNDTVGSLLADIANSIIDSLRVLQCADKSQWGPDEHEQRRRLEHALDEAKKDYQELSVLVNGQRYYQYDRKPDSLNELRTLKTNFQFHTTNFRDWARQGGPINPIWARDTLDLRRQLHRAQCRAARRIFATKQEASSSRCLGAFLVYRKQRAWTLRDRKKAAEASKAAAGAVTPGQEPQQPSTPRTPTQPHRHRRQGSTLVPNDDRIADSAADDSFEDHRRHLEELAVCNAVGSFERFGDRDIAFVCDFCDGHIVWEDLEGMPSLRTVDEELVAAAAVETPDVADAPPGPRIARPFRQETPPGIVHWQATGFSVSTHTEKTVVFAPLAIANHVAPAQGDWVAQLRCPACDEPPADYTPPEGEEEDEGGGWHADADLVLDDLGALEEHLAWQHTALGLPSVSVPSAPASCVLM